MTNADLYEIDYNPSFPMDEYYKKITIKNTIKTLLLIKTYYIFKSIII